MMVKTIVTSDMAKKVAESYKVRTVEVLTGFKYIGEQILILEKAGHPESAFKPTSSISKPQRTYNFKTREMTTLQGPGRHDTCFALRTPVIVEAMAAIVLADLVGMA